MNRKHPLLDFLLLFDQAKSRIQIPSIKQNAGYATLIFYLKTEQKHVDLGTLSFKSDSIDNKQLNLLG